ncbi:tRNA (N6-threonylcarbamoyladenosine(37)-N6)-methyltransferase TrmO [Bacillus haynesii]|uniref:tRNA (N6-threonylcarbamoyladenosine(37)-N6)-methyltransferase TrmO n=1 Tax=Bacillus haynesii TaxID=1925021 RepID=UPI001C21CB42|nr:tRNA (N6-threonylcarbamoyladenosine(37)-N6)-methyltransferase TrmO [Bacillus haynesii]MBU8685127.1 tRNA (N6-threonylcarbamoyladenosine(37)-N6)-methyltransferase TrmO [Bacillus haynesii]MCY8265106.1 tRNA (N6-threonylcarbamoyladenosine(37)-N6)-methyltransferase TrmO [Bacillus haynesii]MCY8355928.1 tRNA (N6-threonylcarbamoyladenosine(37)-N6)-methyltransferase TrmO [Bacillus haynesii]MCY8555891.1 tRNA (N6-threonylcarbamoyladenosine(37)-N6)-methyltransferase TrmO [Bacillus haynesii]MCY8582084.1 
MIEIKPVAFVKNLRILPKDDHWGDVISEIKLAEDIHPDALKGIEAFSHLDIIFYFHQVKEDQIQYQARRPRNNQNYPETGIFAQRGKNRPNRLGATVVTLLEKSESKLVVKGLDAIDGTPVIDIKPVMKEFLPKGQIIQPKWSEDLMKAYWHDS